jgi:DNA mismatch repair protein MutL
MSQAAKAPRIQRLPSQLVDQIAAGEVVERPASVVKELVENALDAGARRVTVEITGGGVTSIAVNDDGEGMTEVDAVLATERHATSKVRQLDDLLRLHSYGFRGEALPSIASVSQFELRTRTKEQSHGTVVRIHGGAAQPAAPIGCPVGTTVQVNELFFNVPARRKFLKSTATESAHISEVIQEAALSRPEVTFVLLRDGRKAKEFLAAKDRGGRAHEVFPDEELGHARGEAAGLAIEAWLTAPERARSGATGLHLVVNGRPVRDHRLARAVAHAYGSVLEPGRYPVGVVYIDIPTEQVDINVHPRKTEVRFADGRALYDQVVRTLSAELRTVFNVPALGAGPYGRSPGVLQAPFKEAAPGFVGSGGMGSDSPWTAMFQGPALGAGPSALAASTDALPLFGDTGLYGRLRFLSQLRCMYLLCEGDDGLYILDQHAAAERLAFSRLRQAYLRRAPEVQRLLVPETVELSEADTALLAECETQARDLGIELRAVGPRTIAVDAVPAMLTRVPVPAMVRDLCEELSRVGARRFADVVDQMLATMACHGSIRAGDTVDAREVQALLAGLDGADFAGHCPHGRPIVLRMSFGELERRVGR